jgi:pimeloyl-ACP methyl ester carboxylesterase
MPRLRANGIDIEYESAGPENGPTILLIMGLAGQLTQWPQDMVDRLVAGGYRVVRFDNRDIGLTDKNPQKPASLPLQMLAKRLRFKRKFSSYTLHDMARDTVCVLDGLGIAKAHIVGVSMGGMIGQVVASTYPDRVETFTAIMTTTNDPKLPRARSEIGKAIISGKRPQNREEAILRSLSVWDMIGTKDSGAAPEDVRARVEAAFDRSSDPAGVRRQISAIIETGDLTEYTRKIKAPTLVLHGSADPLVPIQCGQAVARNIKGSRMHVLNGMGHDLPPKFVPEICDQILAHTQPAPKVNAAPAV